MIADAIDKVGADGVLSIESSSSFETTVDVEEGMEVCNLNVKLYSKQRCKSKYLTSVS